MMKISEIEEKLNSIKKNIYEALGRFKDDVLVITNNIDFDIYIKKCIESGVIAIDTETNNSIDTKTCELMGLCLYSPGAQKQAYVPINHRDPETKQLLSNQLSCDDVMVQLQKVLDSKIVIVMHNGKFDYEVIKTTCHIEVSPHWDTLIGASLLNENEPHGLKELYKKYIDPSQRVGKLDKLVGDFPYAYIDPSDFSLYAATDSLMTYKLYEYQKNEFSKRDNKRLFELFKEIEMKMVPIVAEMELYGAKVDLDYCEELRKKYEKLLNIKDGEIEKKLCELQPVINHWKESEEAQHQEYIYPLKSGKRNDFEKKNFNTLFPFINDKTGERYKLGKKKIQLLSDPINLNSTKQTYLLFFEIFNLNPVKSKNPVGTGSDELKLLKAQIKDDVEIIKDPSKLKKRDGTPIDEKGINRVLGVLCSKYRWFIFDKSIEKIDQLKNIIIDLERVNDFCDLLLERREITKLIQTYIKVVPPLGKHWGDGKIRFHLNPLGAQTGRFTSGGSWKFLVDDKPYKINGMNSQNIPNNKSHEIRLMFKAEEGRAFVSGDFSQQEPKVTAFLSSDPKMVGIFEQGKDIYASISAIVLNEKYENCLEFHPQGKEIEFEGKKVICGYKTHIWKEGKDRRSIGKKVILALMYGMSASGLASQLNISTGVAQAYLDEIFDEFSEVKIAIDKSQSNCYKYGYVEGLKGRRRRLPNIRKVKYEVSVLDKTKVVNYELLNEYVSKLNDRDGFLDDSEFEIVKKEALKNNLLVISNELDIEKAKRQCFNAKIQGSAATMTKKTMILIYENQMLKELDAHMIFQIHDEIMMDCPKANAQKVSDILKYIMEHVVDSLEIPMTMKCDMVIEDRWGEASMTEDIKSAYEDIKKNIRGGEDPLTLLYGEFPNIPKESLKRIIENPKEVLRF